MTSDPSALRTCASYVEPVSTSFSTGSIAAQGNLGLRRGFDLRGGLAGQQLLRLAVGLVAAERRIALPRRGVTALRRAA